MEDKIKIYENVSIISYSPEISSLEEWINMPVSVQIRRFINEEEYSKNNPYNISRFGYESLEAGLIVNGGGDLAWKLIRGDSALTPYNNANSFLGVGDSTTAAAVGQTDLQAATNKLRKAQDTSFPKVNGDSGGPSSRQIMFRSTFGATDANFDWREFAIFNASSSGTMLDRFVSTQGTKAANQAWELSITVTLS